MHQQANYGIVGVAFIHYFEPRQLYARSVYAEKMFSTSSKGRSCRDVINFRQWSFRRALRAKADVGQTHFRSTRIILKRCYPAYRPQRLEPWNRRSNQHLRSFLPSKGSLSNCDARLVLVMQRCVPPLRTGCGSEGGVSIADRRREAWRIRGRRVAALRRCVPQSPINHIWYV